MTENSNRLAAEKSPYLLQHASNPVDWYPWGSEAFEKAKTENKLIFLSIGYATCHWCHVMERESFEDDIIAEIMNRLYVAVKVDREERPDVDQIYMKALQATGQHGGWPLNMFLAPDLRPITGGTYFPPVSIQGRPSFAQVLESIGEAWQKNSSQLIESANALTDFLLNTATKKFQTKNSEPEAETNRQAAIQVPTTSDILLKKSYEQLLKSYDQYNGGFLSNGPNKFPPSMNLIVLLRFFAHTHEPRPMQMIEQTLEAMKRGGIYDQIGGGLSRYSTDHDWLVPHFEKMLYDNALFLRILTTTYHATGKEHYKHWAFDIINYISRDMTSPEGAFYSAEDADSEGEEGKFYVWSFDEFDQTLSEAGFSVEEKKLLMKFWNVTTRGNFEGKNILHEPLSRTEFLQTTDREVFNTVLDRGRAALFTKRSQRVRPLCDDKILTSWNGLLISSLARAGWIFNNTEPLDQAEKAFAFLWDNCYHPATGKDTAGTLYRRYRSEAAIDGGLVDYATFGLAALDLYRATFKPEYFQKATILLEDLLLLFSAEGFFYDTRANTELLVRMADAYDGVEPSGNSSAANLMAGLALYGYRTTELLQKLDSMFETFHQEMDQYPSAHPFLILAHDLSRQTMQIVISTGDKQSAMPYLDHIRKNFLFDLPVVLITDDIKEAEKIVPLAKGKSISDSDEGSIKIYICENQSCLAPLTTYDEFTSFFEGRQKGLAHE